MPFSSSASGKSESPKLILTSQDAEFDLYTIQSWHSEGFDASYLPFTTTQREYERQLKLIPDSLEAGVKYAIVGKLSKCNLCLTQCYGNSESQVHSQD